MLNSELNPNKGLWGSLEFNLCSVLNKAPEMKKQSHKEQEIDLQLVY